MKDKFIVKFREVGKDDVALVGGKGANLGEMAQNEFPVPDGFIVTSTAYYAFIQENNLQEKIRKVMKEASFDDTNSLQMVSKKIKKLILSGHVSEELTQEIFNAYKKLGNGLRDTLVAVRSSATAEDLPDASFAGQQETYLNVQGEANVLLKVKEAWASLFDARAIFYRNEKHFDHFKVGIAIPVQKMVQSEKSGVMFSIDPVTNDKTRIIIEAIYGLGELIVQGAVTPDHYEVAKKDTSIIQKSVSQQTVQLVKSGAENKKVKIPSHIGKQQKITDHEIVQLGELSKKLEKHYFFPQDSEWAIEKGHIFLVQTRPVTTFSSDKDKKIPLTTTFGSQELRLLVAGDAASPGLATGPVKILKSARDIGKIVQGDVLVTAQTNPDFVPAMKKAVAIVTDMGGKTSHAAIISREIGIPAVVGTKNATKVLKDGVTITVNGTKGEIYQGSIQATPSKTVSTSLYLKTATKIYVNLAEPEFASIVAKRHADGVGLLRAEFMAAGIGTHPKKMIKDGKKHVFIEKLAEGLESFAKSFSPRPVVYRATDFKTNEYRNLIGGKEFEPEESNPMLGYRGAYRYMHDPQVFKLELEAIKVVRNKKGYKNLWLMLPFVRTVNELVKVKQIISDAGLYRSPTFKLWMMVEIPSNVILLEEFIKAGIDGVSIGSNDLTMLLLGTDRDNSQIATEFDEQNDAVLWAFEKVIKTCNTYKVTSSLCGQAASQYPKLVEKLVHWGITSVSVSPDAIDTTRELISGIEKKLL
jgi:pyruvate,water dikinase